MNKEVDDIRKIVLVTVAILLLTLPLAALLSSRDSVDVLETYWTRSIDPCITEEHANYVVITTPKKAPKHADLQTVDDYNTRLRETRRWATHPIFNPMFNNAPSYLKYAKIEEITH